MTIRQSIVDAIKAQLLGISTSEGYSFDINGRVTEWRDIPIDEKTEDRGIDIRDTVASRTDEEDEQRWLMSVEIELFEVGDTSPAEVRQMTQDIITAVSGVKDEDYVEGVFVVDAEMDVAKLKHKRISAVMITFGVHYYADDWEI